MILRRKDTQEIIPKSHSPSFLPEGKERYSHSVEETWISVRDCYAPEIRGIGIKKKELQKRIHSHWHENFPGVLDYHQNFTQAGQDSNRPAENSHWEPGELSRDFKWQEK